MKTARWQTVKELFEAALERGAEERKAFLKEACAGDQPLLDQVEALIVSYEQDKSFMESPAVAGAASSLVEDQTRSLIGRSIGSYRIVREIGRGGMGDVYLADDNRLGRRVALKLLPAMFTRDQNRLSRFQQEARIASSLSHPNICVIHGVGETEDGRHYIVMEYVEGQMLSRHMAEARMKLGEVVDVGAQIASALVAAHAAGVVHRDIKPDNVMLRQDGIIKVLDFGLAKLTQREALDLEGSTRQLVETQSGMVQGTIAYMSPEQARSLPVDARTDIWSLGVVLYQMITGRVPFEGATTSDVLVAILDREPLPLARYSQEVPGELERIVTKALCKDRDQRYQTVKELLDDLKDLTEERAFEARLERSALPESASRTDVTPDSLASRATDSRSELRSSESASAHTLSTATAAERDEGSRPTEAKTGSVHTIHSREVVEPRATSSTRIVIGEIKRHKFGGSLILAAIVLAAVAAYFYSHRQPVLTEKDTILLADFVNTTGEPVFDGPTLKQGLAVQLQQSPFLNLFPDEGVRHALRLMNKPPDEKVTRDVGREIALRRGLKAVITGAVARFDRNYSLTLEAINSQTGETIALTQVETEGKDQVLKALSQAATQLREKLGESLSSIQRSDKPLQEATTSKLEAFQAYALGNELAASVRFTESIPIFERAVEIDPDFASAYSMLSVMHNVIGRPRRAAEYAEKAYGLRDRVGEYEKLRITSRYHGFVNGDETKRIEVLILQKRIYPRDWSGPNDLAGAYNRIGKFDLAIAEARESIGLNPNFAPAHRLLGLALLRFNRFAEASDVITQALQQKLDQTDFHFFLYQIAFINNDTAGMQQQLDWTLGKPDEYVAFDWQTGAAAFAGQWRRAQSFSRRAIDLASRGDAKEVAARYEAEQALRAAVFRQFAPAKAAAAQSLALERNQVTLTRAALALALCGESSQTQPLVDELARRYPRDTLAGGLWLPVIRAVLELQRGNAAQAIELLEAARRYEPAAEFWPQYVRGQSYLKLNEGAEAAAEFQKILDHRGEAPLSALYPLAHLGVARAAALTGDVAKSRIAYLEFLTLWGSADPDTSILIEAKKEYEKVK